MTLLAVTPPPAAQANLLPLIIGLFWLYVPLCFIFVGLYVAKQIRQGRLINTANSPMPFAVSGLSGSLFALMVIQMLFLGAPLLIFILFVLVGIGFLLMETGHTAAEQFGLARLRPARVMSWSLLLLGAIVLVEWPLMEIVAWLFHALHLPDPEQQTVIAFRHFNRPSQFVNFMLEAVVLSPLIEELFFRGFLFTFLKKYTSTWMALILSSGVFAFMHVSLGAALPLWFLGLALGLAYEHTGSLLLPITLHSCWNLATALSLLLDKVSPS
jgi:membrane protease YdiL (CAAX protease family)